MSTADAPEPAAATGAVATDAEIAAGQSWWRRATSSIATRVAGQLAIALLPIGAIAMYQAWQITHQEARKVETALLTATAEAAAGEALAVAGAAGSAQALAAHVAETPGATGGPDCSAVFSAAVEDVRQFSFAGYVDAAGTLVCGSSGVGRDMRDGAVYPMMSRAPASMVVANRAGAISGTSVIISAAPVFFGDSYGGFVAISVPHTRIRDVVHAQPGDGPDANAGAPLRIVTFNADGMLLSAREEEAALDEILPAGTSLRDFVYQGQQAFTAENRAGEARVFAVVPIIPGVIYALGSQPPDQMGWSRWAPLLFPGLMLLAGLVVAFYAVDRLVIRHIRTLRRQMGAFSRTRRIDTNRPQRRLPREFAEIDATWYELANHLMRDEAELENMVHEKNVLLKEVHHRVKNNLQLIASIVNLKVRRAKTEEARRVLGEVRARVQSIASVHLALYESPSAGRVKGGELLGTVIGATIEAGTHADRPVEVTQRYDEVPLYPDQAVPFLLLASEAVTNALKYIGTPPDGPARLEITLEAPDGSVAAGGKAVFRVVNTTGTPFHPPEQVKGSGLGQSLLAGFATQLGSTLSTEEAHDAYVLQVSFTPAPFDPDVHSAALAGIEDRPGASS